MATHKPKPTPPASGAGFFNRFSPLTLDLLCVGLLYAVTLVLFRGIIFDNAAFASEGDTATAMSYAAAGNRIAQAEGVEVLWMPNFFSGMPTFGNVAYIPRNINYLQTTGQSILNLLYLNGKWTWLIVYCLISGIGMLFLVRAWGYSRPAALIAAFTVMLSPYAVGLPGEGHGSKLMALSYLPLLVLLTHKLFERRDVLTFGLFSAGVGTLMLTNHMQMVYYVFVVMGLYMAYAAAQDLRGNPARALMRVVLFAGGLAVGFAISSYIYLSVYEYAQYSMRGGGTAGAAGGLAFDYATNWSWHPGEIVTLLIPGFYGMKADLYWGPIVPWTNSCVYIGLVPLLFGAIALAYERTRLVVFFAATSLLLVLVSFGRNIPFLYDLLFTTLPFFNKFRAPEQLLHLLPFTTGILAAAGYSTLAQASEKGGAVDRAKLTKILLVIGGILGAALLIALAAKNGLFDTLSGSMFLKDGETAEFRQRYGAQAQQAIAQYKKMRFDVFWKDYVKFSLLAVALIGLVIAWLRGKVRAGSFAAGAVALVVIDLALVSSKYIDPKPSVALEQAFRPDATVAFLLKQPGVFRVFPLGGQLFMDNTYAYHGLQSVGGYSPAKLKIYQTMLDSCMYQGADPAFPLNMNVVNMLNVEYLVAPGMLPEGKFELVNADQARRIVTYRNPGRLPRAFFVDTVVTATTDYATFKFLNDSTFRPAHAAVLPTALPSPIVPADPTTTPVITSYASREIRVATDTKGTSLLVLSEIYYPAGWSASVDGAATEIYRTDYLLRSVLVPAGKHEVVFSFNPSMYSLGWALSNAGWGVAGACVLVGLFRLPALRRILRRPDAEHAEARG